MIVQAHRKVLIPMRSVIHEASTIAKAIEQGWIKAGKPKDFTVKIFEEPQKNFFGLTSKNAKIGIFIDERQHRQDNRPKKHVPHHRRQRHQRRGPWGSNQQERSFDRPEGQGQRHQDGPRQHGHEQRQDQQRPHQPRHQGHNDKHQDGPKHEHNDHDGHHHNDEDKE
jgi:predicted RNA-binding protein Jag